MKTISIVTSAGGAYTADVFPINGLLMRISYKPDASTPLDTGADLVITESASGIAIYTQANLGTAAFTKLPRAPIASSVDGADSTTVFDYIPIVDKITVSITNGGSVKSGKLFIVFGESN